MKTLNATTASVRASLTSFERKTCCYLLLTTSLLVLGGCASADKAPSAELQAAEQAISNAEQAQVARYSSIELNNARTEISAARVAVLEKNLPEARRQVAESVELYGKYLPLRSALVFGGVKINPQMMALRKGTDILIATPGRLMDLYQQNAVRFNQLEVLVLDEADRMLDMGFIRDIKKILALLPPKRQNLLFSATFSTEIRALAKGLLTDPLEVTVTPPNSTVERIEQWLYPVDKAQKANLLIQQIKQHNWQQVLVFTKTKHGANKLTLLLEKAGITAMAIHGNKSQNARTKALADFKAGAVRVLVATDIAARGLDIQQLPQVVNFELPNVAEDYVHRIGRTGRAGAAGLAISLVCAEEMKELKGIERLIKQAIPRQVIASFAPVQPLPETVANPKPLPAKKPKKPRTFRPKAAAVSA
ncbi:helicase-related protein [Alishewanella longhuensis]